MNIYHTIDKIDTKQVSFYKPVVNKISHYNNFYKIMYNIENFTLNSVLIHVDIKDAYITKELNSYKVCFTIDPSFLDKIKQFEIKILSGINKLLQKQVMQSCFKYLTHNNTVYTFEEPSVRACLRLSGIWESDTHIGFTSKLACY